MKPHCPHCHQELVIRSGKHGNFWACPGYPQCRHTKDFNDWIVESVEKLAVALDKLGRLAGIDWRDESDEVSRELRQSDEADDAEAPTEVRSTSVPSSNEGDPPPFDELPSRPPGNGGMV